MTAYYNEFDKHAAAWLRELIAEGHIAPGDVDERDIQDVLPSDLAGYTQCHFFSGIGVWSYALRQAGWPDDRPVWTGSCPCQPFSAAGKGAAFDDERHLWPAFHHLIEQRRPPVVFGEQVASKDGLAWLDLVHADLEGTSYAFGAADLCSAGVGAPHIRQRLYWVADSADERRHGRRASEASNGGDAPRLESKRLCNAGGLANAELQQRPISAPGCDDTRGRIEESAAATGLRGDSRPGPTNGFWRAADWLGCRDGKWRPVEPGTFPLAHGATARVVKLRGYGNAVNAKAAETFVSAYMGVAA